MNVFIIKPSNYTRSHLTVLVPLLRQGSGHPSFPHSVHHRRSHSFFLWVSENGPFWSTLLPGRPPCLSSSHSLSSDRDQVRKSVTMTPGRGTTHDTRIDPASQPSSLWTPSPDQSPLVLFEPTSVTEIAKGEDQGGIPEDL